MSKIKNRDKRKKAQARKLNQKRASQPVYYDGYMQIPLDPNLSGEDLKRRTIYEGLDWSDYKTRVEILSSPRLFKVTTHVVNNKGETAVATIDYQGRGDKATLAEASSMAFRAAREDCAAINMSKSSVVIRAQKDLSKAPKEIDVDLLASKKPIMGRANPFFGNKAIIDEAIDDLVETLPL